MHQADQQRQRANGLQLDIKELKLSYEDKLAAMEERSVALQTCFGNRPCSLVPRHQREVDLLKQHNSRVVTQLSQQFETVPDNLKQSSSLTRGLQAQSAALKNQLQAQYASKNFEEIIGGAEIWIL